MLRPAYPCVEVCSLGNMPYVQFDCLSQDFIEFLERGERMEQGRHWSSYLYVQT